MNFICIFELFDDISFLAEGLELNWKYCAFRSANFERSESQNHQALRSQSNLLVLGKLSEIVESIVRQDCLGRPLGKAVKAEFGARILFEYLIFL
jgi:hypothetical protein